MTSRETKGVDEATDAVVVLGDGSRAQQSSEREGKRGHGDPVLTRGRFAITGESTKRAAANSMEVVSSPTRSMVSQPRSM